MFFESDYAHKRLQPEFGPSGDGTRQLLQWGASMLARGFWPRCCWRLCWAVLAHRRQHECRLVRPDRRLMCIPFGGFLAALGLAKALRNRALARKR